MPFAAPCLNLHTADEAAIRFLAFADAAFPRTYGNGLLAVLRIAPNQPFRRNIGRQFQTYLSLRLG